MIGLSTVIQVLGVSGLCVSRAFGPLFMLALCCRIVHDHHLDVGLLPLIEGIEPWFIRDDFLIGSAVCGWFECALHHSRFLREKLRGIEVLYKALAAVVAFVGLGAAGDHLLRDTAWARSVFMAFGVELRALAFAVFACALILGLVRRSALARLCEHDRDDELGLQRLTAWGEDLWTLLVPPLFVLCPLSALGAVALAFLMFWRVRRSLRVREETDKVICYCGQLNYRPALRCAHCGGRNQAPSGIGWFGQATSESARDLLQHAFTLFEVKRCPRCASHLAARAPAQVCQACGQSTASDPLFLSAYDRWVRGRMWSTLFVTGLLGAVPVLGLLPSLLCARRGIVLPYGRYVVCVDSFLSRWGLRVGWFVAILLQIVPGAGAIGVPLMAFSSHRAHRAVFMRSALHDDDDAF